MTIRTLLLVPALALSGQLLASPALLLFGASHHSACDTRKFRCQFESFNPGAGIEWGWDQSLLAGGMPLVRAGVYRDSYDETAAFMAAGWRRTWPLGGRWEVGVIVLAGYLHGSGIDGFAALPLATLGYGPLALELAYIPKGQVGGLQGDVAVTSVNLRWAF